MKTIKSTLTATAPGTGNSSLARKIHEGSNRTGRFVHLNLSSFADGVLESELFGHVKGAFTGAINDKSGAMLEAHNGTLFLDEIDSIPLSLQTKLLLFFDSLEIRPVGGNISRKATSRLIFASGKNLFQQVEQGLMRKDFYFRIGSSVHIQLKSLREKPEALEAFVVNHLKKNGSSIEASLLQFYKNYSWPGNFRQLKGHLEKKCLGNEGKYLVLDQEDLGLRLNQFTTNTQDGWPTLREMKLAYVLRSYNYFNKNVAMTASALSVSIRTLKTLLDSDLVLQEVRQL